MFMRDQGKCQMFGQVSDVSSPIIGGIKRDLFGAISLRLQIKLFMHLFFSTVRMFAICSVSVLSHRRF